MKHMNYQLLNSAISGANVLSKFRLILKNLPSSIDFERKQLSVWPPRFLFKRLNENNQKYITEKTIKVVQKQVEYYRIEHEKYENLKETGKLIDHEYAENHYMK